MIRLHNVLAAIRRDRKGTMVIETAIVAPVLILLSIGAFEASRMVARQAELQSAAAEASSIVLAAMPTTDTQINTIEDIIEASSGLPDANVSLTKVYRCGTDADYVTSADSCADVTTRTNYIRIRMRDMITPQWSHLGIGGPVHYNVERTVQVS